MTARSFLYVPGDSGERLERSTSRGADAVIADLEDAVAPAAQLSVIHRVFTPSEAAVEAAAARRTMSRYEAAVSAGLAVLTDADGSMVDEAVVRASRRTLALARSHTRAES